MVVYAPTKRKLTVAEYHRMGEIGIFGHEDRVELLDGQLYQMSEIGEGHVGGTVSLTYFLSQRIGDRALVSAANPVVLSDFSEPEPDIVLLKPRADFYRTRTPHPEDVLLLIEVADSSLGYDRDLKLPRYAEAGIIEYWIVNLRDRQVEVYRDPAADGYRIRTVHGPGDTVTVAALPDVSIRVEEIIG